MEMASTYKKGSSHWKDGTSIVMAVSWPLFGKVPLCLKIA